jgi:hypothetical protein
MRNPLGLIDVTNEKEEDSSFASSGSDPGLSDRDHNSREIMVGYKMRELYKVQPVQ